MFPTFLASIAILARNAAHTSVYLVRLILPGVLTLIVAIEAFGLAAYETAYIDASGSRCLAFRITSEREADLCSGLFDREGLDGKPPVYIGALPIGGGK